MIDIISINHPIYTYINDGKKMRRADVNKVGKFGVHNQAYLNLMPGLASLHDQLQEYLQDIDAPLLANDNHHEGVLTP